MNPQKAELAVAGDLTNVTGREKNRAARCVTGANDSGDG